LCEESNDRSLFIIFPALLPSVSIQALLSLLFLTSSNVFQLVNMMGIAVWLAIGCSVLVIPWLR
jgi:hypothetical protein